MLSSQSFFLHSLHIVNDSHSSNLVELNCLLYLVLICLIFIRSLLFPSIWGKLPQQRSLFRLFQLAWSSYFVHVLLYFFKDLVIFHLSFSLKTITKVLLSHWLQSLELLPHSCLITIEIRLSFFLLIFTGFKHFLFNFESDLLLEGNYLRNQPFNSGSVLVKYSDVAFCRAKSLLQRNCWWLASLMQLSMNSFSISKW